MTDNTASVSTRPIRALFVALGLTAVALPWLAWNTAATATRMEHLSARNLRISELRGTIVTLDEVLTMSARMAAATGDQHWEERYRIYDPQLVQAIAEAQALAPDTGWHNIVARIDSANSALMELENRAFGLARQHRLPEARATVFSGEYDRHKRVYAAGMDSLRSVLNRSIAAAVAAESRSTEIVVATSLSTLVVLIICWVVALRAMHHWRGALLRNQVRLARQAEELSALNAFAEQEVKVLQGILPICASCKRIKDGNDTWEAVESYVRDHTNAEFSHGLCPDCAARDWGTAPAADRP
jgi:hypothetical protein